jgi:hypothetical protein
MKGKKAEESSGYKTFAFGAIDREIFEKVVR